MGKETQEEKVERGRRREKEEGGNRRGREEGGREEGRGGRKAPRTSVCATRDRALPTNFSTSPDHTLSSTPADPSNLVQS
jgi:hypothetical protein